MNTIPAFILLFILIHLRCIHSMNNNEVPIFRQIHSPEPKRLDHLRYSEVPSSSQQSQIKNPLNMDLNENPDGLVNFLLNLPLTTDTFNDGKSYQNLVQSGYVAILDFLKRHQDVLKSIDSHEELHQVLSKILKSLDNESRLQIGTSARQVQEHSTIKKLFQSNKLTWDILAYLENDSDSSNAQDLLAFQNPLCNELILTSHNLVLQNQESPNPSERVKFTLVVILYLCRIS